MSEIERPPMPSSSVRAFSDPDECAAAIRGATVQLVLAARGVFHAKLTRIALHHLQMHRLAESLPRIAHTAIDGGRACISFSTRPGPNLRWRGQEMRSTARIRHGEAQSYYQRSLGSAGIASMSLPIEKIATIGGAIAGSDLTPPPDSRILTPPASAMARLQWLHAQTGRLAEEAPHILADPEAARGLEQALIQAMVRCVVGADARPERAAFRRRTAIMRRFQSVLETHPERALYLADICVMIGVSARTLHRCCQEQLGTGPIQFLLLRRLHLARLRLREADAATASVTGIAMQLGFWELGRFAIAYKSLFGESPSATLRAPSEARRGAAAGPAELLAEFA